MKPLSDRSTDVMQYAQEEAFWNGSTTIRPEHILLGIIRNGGVESLKIIPDEILTLEHLRHRLLGETLQSIQVPPTEMLLSDEASQRIAWAIEESESDNSLACEPEHLMLGLLHNNDDDGVATQFLRDYGLTRAKVRDMMAW